MRGGGGGVGRGKEICNISNPRGKNSCFYGLDAIANNPFKHYFKRITQRV